MTKYEQHPLSAAFPSMSADEFESLKDSIESIGVQTPAVLYEGMVIDGWHRYTAATAVGANCPTVELGDVDPRDFVLAQNKARRHLTASQRALATAAVYEWRPAGKPSANPAPGAGLPMKTDRLAEIAGVSERTIRQAKVVESSASSEVKEAVRSGDISVKRGAEIAKLPKRQQGRALYKPAPVKDVVQEVAQEEEAEDFGPSEEEIRNDVREQQEELESLRRIAESDDRIAAAMAEAKRYREQVRVLEERRDSLMNLCNEQIKMIKSLRRKLEAGAAA